VKAGVTNVCNVTGGVLALSASRATMNQGAAAHG
jgi:hypothetical protein